MSRLKKLWCASCGRFLGDEDIREGEVRLKCPNCKNWNILIGRRTDQPFSERTRIERDEAAVDKPAQAAP